MSQRYSILIIGAGNMGAFFDHPGQESVLSHAHAFFRHPGFDLTGFVDVDSAKAEKAAALWGGRAFQSIGAVMGKHPVDLAVVATPDALHYEVLKEVAGYPIKCVFAEKPLAQTIWQCAEVISCYEEKRITLGVNYSRRFVAAFEPLRLEMASGAYGKFLNGSGTYGKGTLHNGSHLVDLIRSFLGEIKSIVRLASLCDWSEEDPSCSALLRLENGGQIVIQALDCRCFTVFELDLLFERKRVRLVDSGMTVELQDVQESRAYPGYRVLSPTTRCEVDLSGALTSAAENLYQHLCFGLPIRCSAADGLRAVDICTQILRQPACGS